MKTIFYTLLAVSLYSGLSLSAQNNDNTIYLKGANFTHPILKVWIDEYSKINPNTNIQIADKNTANTDNSIAVISTDVEESNPSQVAIQVARYAILPIANKNNPLLAEINDKSLDKNNIKRLFFEKDADDEGKYPFKNEATIYSGTSANANIAVVSEYFDKAADQIKGKRIAGDDIYLINAVKKDPQGVAFNYLSYIYDTKTRKLKEDITLLPINLKKDQWQAINGSIDETLQLLESQKINLIPVKAISLSFDTNQTAALQGFLSWVVTEGQKYNHQYGFLNIDAKQQNEIKRQINYASLTQK